MSGKYSSGVLVIAPRRTAILRPIETTSATARPMVNPLSNGSLLDGDRMERLEQRFDRTAIRSRSLPEHQREPVVGDAQVADRRLITWPQAGPEEEEQDGADAA